MSVLLFNNTIYAQNVSVIEKDGIKMHVYNAAPESFSVTATLLEGEKEAVLVNALFSKGEAEDMVDLIHLVSAYRQENGGAFREQCFRSGL